jgi:hypothetical protein
MSKLAAYPVADHGPSDGAANHEPGPSRLGSAPRRWCVHGYRHSKMDDEPLPTGPPAESDGGVEVRALPQSERGRKHGSSGFRATSGRKALTALSATSGKNRAAGPGAHAQPETVGLRTAAVVRLERALTHSGAPREESVRRVNGPERCTDREMGSSRSQFQQVTRTPYGTGRPATRSNRPPCRSAGGRVRALGPARIGFDACGQRLEPQATTLLASHRPDRSGGTPLVAPKLRKETSGVGERRPCCVHRLWTMVWTNGLLTTPNPRILVKTPQ